MAGRPVPTQLRRPARAARRILRSALGQQEQPRAAAASSVKPQTTPEPDTAGADEPQGLPELRTPAAGLPALQVRVAAALSPAVAEVMAPEWDQQTADRADRELTALQGAQLLLAEFRDGHVPGWGQDAAQAAPLFTAAAQRSVPAALWVTSGPVPAAAQVEWLPSVDQLYASTEQLRREVSTRWGREAELLEAAAQPRTANPVERGGRGRRTGQALTVVDGFDELSGQQELKNVLAAGLKPLPVTETPLVRLPGKSSPVTLPASLATRLHRADSRAHGLDVIATAGVMTDLSACSPLAPWTAVAAAASATPMVAPAGLGGRLPGELSALVPTVEDQKQFRSEIVARMQQPELRGREGHLLQRAVLEQHTAGHRARTLLGAAGVQTPAVDRSVSAVVPTNRLHELDNVFGNIARQRHRDTELVLVLHGLDVDEAELQRRATEAGVPRLVIVRADASLTLGSCMNLGVQASSGRYIAKMDDDNFYGPGYLSDLLDAFSYSDASIVGKWCHLVWLRSTGAVVLRYPDSEHAYERRIQGGAMLFDGDLVRQVGFSDIPRAVDSDILDRSMAEGAKVYSADRYNFVSIRGTDRTAHTWTVTDSTFMTATGQLQFYGDPRPHASL